MGQLGETEQITYRHFEFHSHFMKREEQLFMGLKPDGSKAGKAGGFEEVVFQDIMLRDRPRI